MEIPNLHSLARNNSNTKILIFKQEANYFYLGVILSENLHSGVIISTFFFSLFGEFKEVCLM